MNATDKHKFSVLMKTMSETYGNNFTAPSKEKTEIYFRALADMPIEQLEQAVMNLLNTRKTTTTFPVPAEIRDAVGGKAEDASILALDKLEKAIERHGSYTSVTFDDPVIHMVVVTMGGWPKVCRPDVYGDDQPWVWKQKEFMKLYQVFSKNPRMECPTVLAGICAIENSSSGREYDKPAMIVGDLAKALEWTKNKQQIQAPGTKELVSMIAEKMKL